MKCRGAAESVKPLTGTVRVKEILVQYVNLTVADLAKTDFILSPERHIKAWLMLLKFCAETENGGVIKDCKLWGDLHWSSVCSVDEFTVKEESKLWSWSGNHLCLQYYPKKQEKTLKQNRKDGNKGGRPQKTKPPGLDDNNPPVQVDLKGNGMERKGKEGNRKESIPPISPKGESVKKKKFTKPTREEVEAYKKEKKLVFNTDSFFSHYESNGWKVGKNPMKNWQAACHTFHNTHKKFNGTGEPTTRPLYSDDEERDRWIEYYMDAGSSKEQAIKEADQTLKMEKEGK